MTAAEPHVSLAIETDQRMNDAIIDGNQTPHPQLLMSSMIPVRREGAFDTYDATTMAAFSQTNKVAEYILHKTERRRWIYETALTVARCVAFTPCCVCCCRGIGSAYLSAGKSGDFVSVALCRSPNAAEMGIVGATAAFFSDAAGEPDSTTTVFVNSVKPVLAPMGRVLFCCLAVFAVLVCFHSAVAIATGLAKGCSVPGVATLPSNYSSFTGNPRDAGFSFARMRDACGNPSPEFAGNNFVARCLSWCPAAARAFSDRTIRWSSFYPLLICWVAFFIAGIAEIANISWIAAREHMKRKFR